MLDKAVRCLEHKLSQEKTFLSLLSTLSGNKETTQEIIAELKQAIIVLKTENERLRPEQLFPKMKEKEPKC